MFQELEVERYQNQVVYLTRPKRLTDFMGMQVFEVKLAPVHGMIELILQLELCKLEKCLDGGEKVVTSGSDGERTVP